MIDIKPRIKIGPFQTKEGRNQNGREYSITSQISNTLPEGFQKPFYEDDGFEELGDLFHKIGGVGKLLLERLFSIIGIEEVCITSYSVTIWKASAFHWEEIEPEIIAALKEVFGSEIKEVKVIWSRGTKTKRSKLRELLRKKRNRAIC